MWDPQYGMFLLVESEIQEIFVCGIRNTQKFLFVGSKIVALESLIPAQGIRNPANNWNTTKSQEPSTWNPESTVLNPESKTWIPAFLAVGRPLLG